MTYYFVICYTFMITLWLDSSSNQKRDLLVLLAAPILAPIAFVSVISDKWYGPRDS